VKNLSLRKRIILQTLVISFIVPLVAFFIVSRNNQTAAVYQDIANVSLARVDKLGEMLANFRQIRVEVRSLGLINNTTVDADKYIADTVKAIGEFEKSKNELQALLRTDLEKAEYKKMDVAWEDFYSFGKGLLVLAKKGDAESFKKLAEDVRVVCPIKKEGVEKLIRDFIHNQKIESQALVAAAKESETTTKYFALLGTMAGLVAAVLIGTWFASKVSSSLEQNIQVLSQGVEEINTKSQETAIVSDKISAASSQQAAGLQQTVASIDEISAMVARNADSAASAANTSVITTKSAQNGKHRVEEMLDSIHAISAGNDEINHQMQKSNSEISEIVNLIQDISLKTQVINDIVFQTKLLSFNASVEAARAGEHGKGFAVVAEEVGNLAAMSGKAANEITAMLSKSVQRVTDIVDGTKDLMDKLIRESKQKVEQGTSTAKQCSTALDDILVNVSSMTEMVREISVASQEQSEGVREINRAMSDLDQVTRANSEVAQASSITASDLKAEADKLALIVSELTAMVQGGAAKVPEVTIPKNVVQLKSKKISTPDHKNFEEA
jgi:methyl-accepting chemotaxis protein